MSQNCRPDGGALRRGLPYVDNVGAVLLTAAVNLACVFIFYFGRAVTLHGVLTDSFWCGVITPFICVCFIAPRVAALRREGLLPALQAAQVAAAQGAENTANMRAVHGRAAYYGDQTLGLIDGGAEVGRLIFEALVAAASEG